LVKKPKKDIKRDCLDPIMHKRVKKPGKTDLKNYDQAGVEPNTVAPKLWPDFDNIIFH